MIFVKKVKHLITGRKGKLFLLEPTDKVATHLGIASLPTAKYVVLYDDWHTMPHTQHTREERLSP